jgi:hypothetical protein
MKKPPPSPLGGEGGPPPFSSVRHLTERGEGVASLTVRLSSGGRVPVFNSSRVSRFRSATSRTALPDKSRGPQNRRSALPALTQLFAALKASHSK